MRAFAFLVVLLAGCGKGSDSGGGYSPSAPSRPVMQEIEIHPNGLSEAYTLNPASADQKYKGRTIITKMPWTMERQGASTVARAGRIVYFFVSEEEAAKVQPGTLYRVQGRCEGLRGDEIIISDVRILGETTAK